MAYIFFWRIRYIQFADGYLLISLVLTKVIFKIENILKVLSAMDEIIPF